MQFCQMHLSADSQTSASVGSSEKCFHPEPYRTVLPDLLPFLTRKLLHSKRYPEPYHRIQTDGFESGILRADWWNLSAFCTFQSFRLHDPEILEF